MSESTLYLVFGKSAKAHTEYRNGWGSGPMIWEHLREQFDVPRVSLTSKTDPVWALARNPRVPEHLRLCHAFTFDQGHCPVERISEMADALQQAHEDIIAAGSSTWTHFGQIATDMREIASGKKDHRMIGVALNCTSVADIWSEWTPSERETWDCYAYATDLSQ